jgi:hypothetical protein
MRNASVGAGVIYHRKNGMIACPNNWRVLN